MTFVANPLFFFQVLLMLFDMCEPDCHTAFTTGRSTIDNRICASDLIVISLPSQQFAKEAGFLLLFVLVNNFSILTSILCRRSIKSSRTETFLSCMTCSSCRRSWNLTLSRGITRALLLRPLWFSYPLAILPWSRIAVLAPT